MAAYLESLQRLIEQFGQLDGVGRKSASRMAFSVLEMSQEDAQAFSDAILEAKRRIHLCPICQIGNCARSVRTIPVIAG